MRHHVDRNCHSQNENIVLPFANLHAIGIREAEPFLGHFCDLIAPFIDRIFMVKDITLNIQIGSASDRDCQWSPKGAISPFLMTAI